MFFDILMVVSVICAAIAIVYGAITKQLAKTIAGSIFVVALVCTVSSLPLAFPWNLGLSDVEIVEKHSLTPVAVDKYVGMSFKPNGNDIWYDYSCNKTTSLIQENLVRIIDMEGTEYAEPTLLVCEQKPSLWRSSILTSLKIFSPQLYILVIPADGLFVRTLPVTNETLPKWQPELLEEGFLLFSFKFFVFSCGSHGMRPLQLYSSFFLAGSVIRCPYRFCVHSCFKFWKHANRILVHFFCHLINVVTRLMISFHKRWAIDCHCHIPSHISHIRT